MTLIGTKGGINEGKPGETEVISTFWRWDRTKDVQKEARQFLISTAQSTSKTFANHITATNRNKVLSSFFFSLLKTATISTNTEIFYS